MSGIFGVGSGVVAIIVIGFIIIFHNYLNANLEGVSALLLGFFHLVGGICFYLGYLHWGVDGGIICSLLGPYILYVAFTYEKTSDSEPMFEPWEIFLIFWLLSSGRDHHYHY